jgi:hypothetical protein
VFGPGQPEKKGGVQLARNRRGEQWRRKKEDMGKQASSGRRVKKATAWPWWANGGAVELGEP